MSAQRRSAVAAITAAGLAVLAYLVFIRTAAGQTVENMALQGDRQELEVVETESLTEHLRDQCPFTSRTRVSRRPLAMA